MTQMIMNKIKVLISSTALAGVVLTTSLLSGAQTSAQAQEKAIAQLTPISGWSVKKIAGGTDNAYCALSRQYNQNLVLTLGRNILQEYSLALDFTKGTLNTDKAYSITLQPGPGQIRAYEMMPASARAIVIRLGYDESFFKSLSTSGILKAEIDGKNYHFNVSEFAKGEQDLMGCANGLKGAKPTTKIASPGFSAKKVENAEPIKIAKSEIVDAPKKAEVITPQPAPKVEKTPRAPIKIERAESVQKKDEIAIAPEKPVTIEAVKEPQKQIVMNKVSSEISLKASEDVKLDPVPKNDEVAKVKQEAEAKAHMEAQKLAAEKIAKQKELEAQKIADEKAKELEEKAKQMAQQRHQEEQKALEDQRLAAEKIAKQKAEEAKLAQEKLAKEKLEAQRLAKIKLEEQRVATAKAEAKLKEQQLAEEKLEQERIAKEKLEAQRMADEKIAKQKAEEAKLAQEKLAKDKIEDQQVADAKRATEKVEKIKQVATKPEELDAVVSSVSSLNHNNKVQEELETIRAEKDALEKENRELYLEARKSRAAIDTAVVNTGNQALVKIREYEKKLEAAKADNLALSKEMEELRLIKEDGRLEAVVGDWDLEKSTKRYNEAEREIKRLGLLLEQQRTAHRQEKTELEQMLFDPAVADQAQRSRLAELEAKLASVQRQAGGTVQKISGMPAIPAPNVYRDVPRAPIDERVNIYSTAAQFGIPSIVESQREEKEINRLNDEIKRQNEQLQNYKRQEASITSPTFPRLEETPTQVSAVSARPKVSRASASLSPVEVASLSNRTPAENVIPQPSPSSFGKNEIQKILNKSKIGVNGQIIQRGAGQYQWSAGKLKGQAQVVPVSQAGSMDQFVKSFIASSKRSCQGDFASLPAPDIVNGQAFEIACIGTASNMSSSLIFTQIGDNIVEIGHEISADDMDVAMDARDRIAGSL